MTLQTVDHQTLIGRQIRGTAVGSSSSSRRHYRRLHRRFLSTPLVGSSVADMSATASRRRVTVQPLKSDDIILNAGERPTVGRLTNVYRHLAPSAAIGDGG